MHSLDSRPRLSQEDAIVGQAHKKGKAVHYLYSYSCSQLYKLHQRKEKKLLNKKSQAKRPTRHQTYKSPACMHIHIYTAVHDHKIAKQPTHEVYLVLLKFILLRSTCVYTHNETTGA